MQACGVSGHVERLALSTAVIFKLRLSFMDLDSKTSSCGDTSIHHHRRTHARRSLETRQVRSHRCDFLGSHEPTVRLPCPHCRSSLLRVVISGGNALYPGRIDRAGSDAIDAHTVSNVINR